MGKCSSPCKTILKMDEGGTETNELEDEKIDVYALGLTSKIWYGLYMSRKEERELASIKNWMHQYEDLRTMLKRAKKDQIQWPVTALII